MRNHIKHFHPEEEEKQLVVLASNQRTIEQTISNFPPNLERAKRFKDSIETLIAKDLCSYSAMLFFAQLVFQHVVQKVVAQCVEMQAA